MGDPHPRAYSVIVERLLRRCYSQLAIPSASMGSFR
jgi:hypothetical protein